MIIPYLLRSFSFTIDLVSCYSAISNTTENGQYISPSISIPITGLCSISASSPKAYPGNTLSILIADYYLKIEFSPDFVNYIQPKNYQSIFAIMVSVYDSINITNLYQNQSFIINIKLTPNKELIGDLAEPSINGVAEFSSLNISIDYTYVVSAYGIGVISARSEEFKVGTYYIKVMFKGEIVRNK